jgi:hypothetical protein
VVILKNKNFFLGLGIGIIFSSLIFYMSFIVINKTTTMNNKSTEISDEEVISRAKKLGMVAFSALPDTKPTVLSNEEVIAKASELGMIFKTDEKIKESSTVSKTSTQPKTAVQEQTQVQAQTQTSITTETLDVRILGGSAAETVAQTLYELGLVDDATNFNKYIRDNDKSTKLRAGYFKINKGSSYEEILTILTTPPSK